MEIEEVKPTKNASFVTDVAAWMLFGGGAGYLTAYGGSAIWFEYFGISARLITHFSLLIAGLISLLVMALRSSTYNQLLFTTRTRRELELPLEPEQVIQPHIVQNNGRHHLFGNTEVFKGFTASRWLSLSYAVRAGDILNSARARTLNYGDGSLFPNCAAKWSGVYSPELKRLGFLDADERVTPLLHHFVEDLKDTVSQTTTTTTETTGKVGGTNRYEMRVSPPPIYLRKRR